MADQLNLDGSPDVERTSPGRWPTKKDAVRWLLSDGKWHSARELAKFAGHRFGACIFELRNEGLQLEHRWAAQNRTEYRWPAPGGDPCTGCGLSLDECRAVRGAGRVCCPDCAHACERSESARVNP